MFASTLCPSLSINHIPSFSIPDIRSFNNHSCIFHLYYLLQYSPLPHLPAVHFSSSIFNLACISVIQHDFQMGAWSGLHDHVLNFGTSFISLEWIKLPLTDPRDVNWRLITPKETWSESVYPVLNFCISAILGYFVKFGFKCDYGKYMFNLGTLYLCIKWS